LRGYVAELSVPECGDVMPIMPCGDGPAKGIGAAWLVLRAHGRRTPDSIVFSD